MNYRTLCRFIAMAILLSVVAKWPMFSVIASIRQEHGGIWAITAALAVLVLALMSVVGLWGARKWGFVVFYLYVVSLMVMFGVLWLPIDLHFLTSVTGLWGGFWVNGTVVALIAFAHWKHPGRKAEPAPPDG